MQEEENGKRGLEGFINSYFKHEGRSIFEKVINIVLSAAVDKETQIMFAIAPSKFKMIRMTGLTVICNADNITIMRVGLAKEIYTYHELIENILRLFNPSGETAKELFKRHYQEELTPLVPVKVEIKDIKEVKAEIKEKVIKEEPKKEVIKKQEQAEEEPKQKKNIETSLQDEEEEENQEEDEDDSEVNQEDEEEEEGQTVAYVENTVKEENTEEDKLAAEGINEIELPLTKEIYQFNFNIYNFESELNEFEVHIRKAFKEYHQIDVTAQIIK